MLARARTLATRAAAAVSVTRSFGKLASAEPVVAVVGATGAVGAEFLRVLEERKFPMREIKLLASARSAGRKLKFRGKEVVVEELTHGSFQGVDLTLFSAGGDTSKKYASAAVKAGAVVVDNSSAFRMDPDVPLVVPEVNPDAIMQHRGIIANPNCSTILMNVAVFPLHKVKHAERIVVSTYQAASGAGAQAMAELEQQARDWAERKPLKAKIFGRQYLWNVFSHNSAIDKASGYNEEELKMVRETRKIFGAPDLPISATCVRVPVLRAHCEAVNVTFKHHVTEDEARELLAHAPGVKIVDDRARNDFPTPLLAQDKDEVLVGRIRSDISRRDGRGLDLFLAFDQIRKGAATNAVQIAELLLP